jgi:hypothetical protein
VNAWFDEKVIHGSPEDRAAAAGQLVSEIATCFLAPAKAATTGAKAAKTAGAVTKVADKASDAAQTAKNFEKATKQLLNDAAGDATDAKTVLEKSRKGLNDATGGNKPAPPSGSGRVIIKSYVPKYSESQINDIIKNLKGAGFKYNPLRLAYENEVSNLAKTGAELLSQGMSKEEVARILHQARRDLGIKYKDATPQPLRDYIYEINQKRHKDPLGPTFDDMMETTGADFDQIIKSAARPNKDIDKLLSGFEQWLKEQ